MAKSFIPTRITEKQQDVAKEEKRKEREKRPYKTQPAELAYQQQSRKQR